MDKSRLLLKIEGLNNELFNKLKTYSLKDKDIYDFMLSANYAAGILSIHLRYYEYYIYKTTINNEPCELQRGQEKKKDYTYSCSSYEDSIVKFNQVLEKWTGVPNFISVNKFTCEHIVHTILCQEKETIHMNYLHYVTGLPYPIIENCINKMVSTNYVYVSKKQWVFVTSNGELKFKENYPNFMSYKDIKDKEDTEKREKEQQKRDTQSNDKYAKTIFSNMFDNLFVNVTLQIHLEVLEMKKEDLNMTNLKKQYRKLSKKYHPDSQTGDNDKFLSLQNSYQYLCNYV